MVDHTMKPYPTPTYAEHLADCQKISDALTEYVRELHRQAVKRMRNNWGNHPN